MAIPKPLCRCGVCRQARDRGVPYTRAGPAAFLHDISLLIDTPAEISCLLNRSRIHRLDYLMFTHLDPDHVEGFRVVEQITLDFRTWRAYPEKRICLLLPEVLSNRLGRIQSQYGPLVEAYEKRGFIRLEPFRDGVRVGPVSIDAIPVDRGEQTALVYVLQKDGRRIVYAPCDVRPFPEHRTEVQRPDLLVIQPGIFETGLRHRFKYSEDHISRTTLYTFEQTLELAARIQAKKILFVHLEEYWHRSYDDYCALESDRVKFAYDGMQVEV